LWRKLDKLKQRVNVTLQFLSLTHLVWLGQGLTVSFRFRNSSPHCLSAAFLCFAISETRTGSMATLSTIAESADETLFTKEVSQSPLKVSPRRVLGDISPNLRIGATQSSAFTRSKPTTPNGSPLKTHLALTPADVLSMKDSYGCPPSVGTRKRPFAAIDGADDDEEDILKRTTTPNNGRVPSMISVRVYDSTSLHCIPDASTRS